MSENLKLQEYNISNINDMFVFLDIIGRQSSHYYFRGQSAKYERLITNIERKAEKNNIPHDFLSRYEVNIIKSYKQQIHNYLNTIPDQNSYIDWLSIIQHYGGPTRLLDFTSSIFTALYFAMQDNEKNAIIYAIHDLTAHTVSQESKHREELQKIINNIDKFNIFKNTDGKGNVWWDKVPRWNTISDHDEISGINKDFINHVINDDIVFPGIFLIQPFFLNKRIIAQQGLFAVPYSLRYSFEDNLKEMFDENYNFDKNNCININEANPNDIYWHVAFKLVIERKNFHSFRYYLRQMNISTSTLFPDLDGLTRSMNDYIPNFEK